MPKYSIRLVRWQKPNNARSSDVTVAIEYVDTFSSIEDRGPKTSRDSHDGNVVPHSKTYSGNMDDMRSPYHLRGTRHFERALRILFVVSTAGFMLRYAVLVANESRPGFRAQLR